MMGGDDDYVAQFHRLTTLAMHILGYRDERGEFFFYDGIVGVDGNEAGEVVYVGYAGSTPHGYMKVFDNIRGWANTHLGPPVVDHLRRVLVLEELARGVAEGLDTMEDGPASTDHPKAKG